MSGSDTFGVIFDMDGVLVDSYQAHLESWQLTAGQYDKTMTEQQFAAGFGQTSRAIIRQLWGSSASDQWIEQFDLRKEEAYRDIISSDIPAVAGLSELLADLDTAGVKMAVGSSGPPENVEAILTGLAIGRYFSGIVTGVDVSKGKPDPQVFLIAAEKLAVSPQRCVVIEDAPAGIEAAHRAGSRAVALTTSYPAERLADADLILPDLTGLSAAKLSAMLSCS